MIYFGRVYGGLVRAGLAGVCFVLGLLLLMVVARSASGGGRAAEFVSAQALAAGSDPIANVGIQGFEFNPNQIKVAPETTVLWTNRDGVDHDVTFRQPDLASPLVGKDGKIAVVFHKPGEYRYYCHVHPFMQGIVIVK